MLIGGFLFLLFLVSIILSAKTWRGWQIATVSIAFLLAAGLMLVAAMSAMTHTVWHERFDNDSKLLVTAQSEGQMRAYGDPSMAQSTEPSLHDVQQKLKRMLLDRGRVWRQCTPGAPTGNSVVVSTVAPDVPEDQIQPNGIDQGTILYVFGVVEVALEDGMRVPAVYLGEFVVAKADDRNITLQPTQRLDALQQKQVADRSRTWSLYEMMPIDSHRAFSNEETIGKMLDDMEKPVFGAITEETIRGLFSTITKLPADNPQVAELAAMYVQDGRPATAQLKSAQPENIWMKLEFQEEHKERVDNNAPVEGLSGDSFDPDGYAEVPQLRRAGSEKITPETKDKFDAKIQVKDIGIFPYGIDDDKKFVDSLISGSICRSLGPYYVRPLRNYEDAFHATQENLVACFAGVRRAQRDIKALKDTQRGTQQEIAYRQEERSKLQSDRDKSNLVRDQITELADGLKNQKQALQDDLSDLYRTTWALSQRLTQLDRHLTEEINRRPAEATAQVN